MRLYNIDYKSLFKERLIKKHGESHFDLSLIPEKFKSIDKINLKCLKTGDVLNIEARQILKRDCKCCKDREKEKKDNIEKELKICKKNDKIENTISSFIERSKINYGDTVDFSLLTKEEWKKDKITLKCKTHNIFYTQFKTNHYRWKGCPVCYSELLSKRSLLPKEEFVRRSEEIHSNEYTYENFIYKGGRVKGEANCPKHGAFLVTPDNHIYGKQRCPKCTKSESSIETKIGELLKNLKIPYERNYSMKGAGMQIDYLCKDINLGIECNGVYWHSEKFKTKNYHKKKVLEANKRGIDLIHIYENEFHKSKAWVHLIRRKVGKIFYNINLNECSVRPVDKNILEKFLNKYDMRGGINDSAYFCYGLFYKNRLIQCVCMSYVKKYADSKHLEIIRNCSIPSIRVENSLSKILDEYSKTAMRSILFVKINNKTETSKEYEDTGFSFVKEFNPNYIRRTENKNSERVFDAGHKLYKIYI